MSEYISKHNHYLAKTFHGLEETLAEELKTLGAGDIRVVKRAVHFTGDLEMMYKANYCLRTALRILKPIQQFEAYNPDQLYKKCKRINWANYFDVKGTFAIDCISNSAIFRHNKFAALRVKDAIADHFRDRYGRRPNVDVKRPDLRINVHINDKKVRISLDSSSDSLHKRGYRLQGAQAPLSEALAAGILLLSGWNGEKALIDPMCGSGTFLVEAAMIAANQAPQKGRNWFGFMNWKNFDKKLWNQVKRKAQEAEKPIEIPILGSDMSRENLHAAQENIHRARFDRFIQLKLKNFVSLKNPPKAPAFLVTNPPYGERITDEDLFKLYKVIGDQLKQQFTGYEAWIFSGNRDALKHIGLKASKRIPLFNGPIECRLQQYKLYK